MDQQEIEARAKGIFERAKAIIMTPKDEWPKIEAETKSQTQILTGYVIPLAAIGPIAGLIGGQVFGYGAMDFSYRPPLVGSIVTAIVSFGLAIAMVYLLASIVDFLAPKFEGQSNKANAFKLVAYGGTASWLASAFTLVPMLSLFVILGLYSLYLYYTGAAPLMKVPQEKSVAYTVVVIVCAFVASILIAPIAAALTGMAGFGALSAGVGSVQVGGNSGGPGGSVTLPGGGSVNLSKLEQMGRQMEQAANGQTKPVAGAQLLGLLPQNIGPYSQMSRETLGAGSMGSTAKGSYQSSLANDHRIDLEIVDMSALGALAGLGSAFGVEESREDANGYERTGTVDGRMQTESWDRSNNRGKFGIVIGNRFMIAADGKAGSIDELKAAVASVDQNALAALAQ